MVIVHIMHTYLIIFYIQLIHPNTIYGILYIYIYLENQKHKMFWTSWEKTVMIMFFGKILFLPVVTKKNG